MTKTDEVKIYLELSDEVEQLLNENQITIKNLLQTQGIEVSETYGSLPYQPEPGVEEKGGIVPIIIASSALVLSSGFAISQVLNEINDRPYLVEIEELEELRDEKGNVIFDDQGNPYLKSSKKPVLIEPTQKNIEREMEINLSETKGIVIKVTQTEKQK